MLNHLRRSARQRTLVPPAMISLLILSMSSTACGPNEKTSQAPAIPSSHHVAPQLAAREPELVSLLNRPLYAAPGGDEDALHRAFLQSIVDLAEPPHDPAEIVWPGRRLGYLWRMNDAVAYYTLAIEKHPDLAVLYRHRGHRYISIRQFDKAIADLEMAAQLIAGKPDEVEADGAPNARNIPLTTTAFNVWYHLGVARYLKGDFAAALAAFHETMNYSKQYDDNIAATTHWTCMTLRRLDRQNELAALLEPIHPDMDIIENKAYHRCTLMYKGLLTPDGLLEGNDMDSVEAVSQAYGAANWLYCNGELDRAAAVFEWIVRSDQWPAFGFIASEVELSRMRPSP